MVQLKEVKINANGEYQDLQLISIVVAIHYSWVTPHRKNFYPISEDAKVISHFKKLMKK